MGRKDPPRTLPFPLQTGQGSTTVPQHQGCESFPSSFLKGPKILHKISVQDGLEEGCSRNNHSSTFLLPKTRRELQDTSLQGTLFLASWGAAAHLPPQCHSGFLPLSVNFSFCESLGSSKLLWPCRTSSLGITIH